jgi:hypothetical protein
MIGIYKTLAGTAWFKLARNHLGVADLQPPSQAPRGRRPPSSPLSSAVVHARIFLASVSPPPLIVTSMFGEVCRSMVYHFKYSCVVLSDSISWKTSLLQKTIARLVKHINRSSDRLPLKKPNKASILYYIFRPPTVSSFDPVSRLVFFSRHGGSCLYFDARGHGLCLHPSSKSILSLMTRQ